MAVKILLINGSPRVKNNSSYLIEKAKEGVLSVSDVEIKTFEFCGKQFAGCKGNCATYCMKHGTCSQKDDDMQEFMDLFLWADGIIWVCPVYHASVPSQVRAVLDRMGNTICSYLRHRIPRFNKPTGIIVHGSSRYGGQELCLDFFLNSITELRCLVVAGDSPKANMGVIGYAPTWEPGSIQEDTLALEASVEMGRNVALMSKIVQAGIRKVGSELTDRFFPDQMFETRRNTDMEIDMAWQKKESFYTKKEV